jgi:lipase ATG15
MMFLSFANFILPLFNILFPPNVPQRPISQTLTFRLRHFHAVTPSAHVYFADTPSLSTLNADTQTLSISTAPVRTARPISAAAFSEARALSMRAQSAALDWEDHEIPGPDISKRETLLLLAKMTSNAYVEPDADAWYNLTDEWGIVRSLGSSALHLQLTLDTVYDLARAGRVGT